MAYSAAVKEAKRAEAIAEIAQIKSSARQAYEQLANASGQLAAMPTKYAGVFGTSTEDKAVVADFQTAKSKVDNTLTQLQALGINALGTSTEA